MPRRCPPCSTASPRAAPPCNERNAMSVTLRLSCLAVALLWQPAALAQLNPPLTGAATGAGQRRQPGIGPPCHASARATSPSSAANRRHASRPGASGGRGQCARHDECRCARRGRATGAKPVVRSRAARLSPDACRQWRHRSWPHGLASQRPCGRPCATGARTHRHGGLGSLCGKLYAADPGMVRASRGGHAVMRPLARVHSMPRGTPRRSPQGDRARAACRTSRRSPP